MKKETLKKIGRYAMLIVGLYVIFIAPRQFATVSPLLFWLGVILIVGFVGWNIFTAYMEYYRKEAKRGEKEAMVTGYVIIVLSVAVFAIVKFSGLSQLMFPGWYQ
jgi:uncharacterized membrane protein YjfL (UPF0719 family)